MLTERSSQTLDGIARILQPYTFISLAVMIAAKLNWSITDGFTLLHARTRWKRKKSGRHQGIEPMGFYTSFFINTNK